MKNFFWIFAFGMCFTTSSYGLRVMTYNVENLWDMDSENTPVVWNSFLKTLTPSQRKASSESECPQYKQYAREFSNYYDPRVFSAKVTNFLKVLELAKYPDVIAVQEIESAGGQSKVFDTPLLDGENLREKLLRLGYPTILLGQQSPQQPVAVTTAFLSKIPLDQMPPVDVDFGKVSSSARNIQVVKFHAGASSHYGPIVLMNGHWKSQRQGGDRERRLIAESVQLRIQNIKRENPRTQVILLGDFNMPYWDKDFQLLQADGDLARLRKQKEGFFNLWFQKKVEDRWDASFSGMKSPLSHILLDQRFFDSKSRLKYVPGSFTVLGQKGPEAKKMLDVSGAPFRWQVQFMSWNYYYHIGMGYSDHLPLIADFSADVRVQPKACFQESIAMKAPEVPQMTQAEACRPEETFDYHEVDLDNLENLVGSCLKIDAHDSPLPLWNAPGGYSAVTLYSERSRAFRDLALGMVNAWDPYPNHQDSRMTLEELQTAVSEDWSYKKPHPRSNRCYVSQVLRSGAGKLRSMVGRLGYTDGVLRLHALSRESEHLDIIDLPTAVESPCAWDKVIRKRGKKRQRAA